MPIFAVSILFSARTAGDACHGMEGIKRSEISLKSDEVYDRRADALSGQLLLLRDELYSNRHLRGSTVSILVFAAVFFVWFLGDRQTLARSRHMDLLPGVQERSETA